MSTNKTAKKVVTLRDARKALADAQALVAQREADHKAAEEAHRNIVNRLSNGDDSVTALDFATAHFAIERAALLIPSARKAVDAAKRALDSAEARENPTLARWLAEVIEASPFSFGLFGFKVIVGEKPKTPEAPTVYLGQTAATKTDRQTGIMSGRVGMTITVPEGVTFTGDQVLSGLAGIEASGNARITAHVSPAGNGVHVSVIVSELKPEIPTLPVDADPRDVDNLAWKLIDSITSKGGTRTVGNGLYEMEVKRITADLGERDLIKRSTSADGEMVRTVRVEFSLSSKAIRAREMAQFAEDSVAALVGNFAPGIGRIRDAQIVDREVILPREVPGREFNPSTLERLNLAVEIVAVAKEA